MLCLLHRTRFEPTPPRSITEVYKKADRSAEKHTFEFIQAEKWKGYTPPPMPAKK